MLLVVVEEEVEREVVDWETEVEADCDCGLVRLVGPNIEVAEDL